MRSWYVAWQMATIYRCPALYLSVSAHRVEAASTIFDQTDFVQAAHLVFATEIMNNVTNKNIPDANMK